MLGFWVRHGCTDKILVKKSATSATWARPPPPAVLACSGWLLLTGFPLSGCRYLNAKRCKSVSLQPTSIHLPFPTICMSRGIIDNKQINCCNLNYIILRFYQNHLNLHWSNHLIPSDSKSIVNVCEVFYCMSWPVAFSWMVLPSVS